MCIQRLYIKLDKYHKVGIKRQLTSIVDDPPSSPVLDDHCQGPYTLVDIDISADHASVLESQGVVDIHIASQLELGIPYLDNGDLGTRYADHFFHAACEHTKKVRELPLLMGNGMLGILTPFKQICYYADTFQFFPTRCDANVHYGKLAYVRSRFLFSLGDTTYHLNRPSRADYQRIQTNERECHDRAIHR